jgi:hypothetical protein
MASSTFTVARLAQSHDALYAQLLAKKSNYKR